jgi:hypothetical protein
VPVGASDGPIVVTVNGFATNGAPFNLVPNILALSPSAGPVGTAVTVLGNGFGASPGFGGVTFNGVSADVQSWSDTSIAVTVSQGATTGNVVVTAANLVGVSSGVNFTVTQPLTIQATPDRPSNAAGWYNASVTISFQCAGGLAPVNCPPTQTVSSEGANQVISGTASDAAGNSASASITVNLDETPPAVAISLPLSGTTVTRPTLRVTGSVSDSLSGIASVSCNGATPVSLDSASYICNVPLAVGANLIQAQAIDNAGNASVSNQITVTYSPIAPNGIFISPTTANMAVGDKRTIKLSGDLGQPISGATWTISDSTIVSMTTDDPPQLTALAAGTATLTANFNGLTASMTVNVLTGPLPFGTPLWSVPSMTGNSINGIIHGNPINASDPDIYMNDGQSTLRGFTRDGQQLWTAQLASGPSQGGNPTLLVQTVPDNAGNTVNVVWKCLVSNCNTKTPAVIGVDNASQSQIWENDLTDGPYLRVSKIAVAPDNTIYLSGVFETGPENNLGIAPTSTLLAAFDGATGATKFTVPLPPSHTHFTLTDVQGNIIENDDTDGSSFIGPLAVMADGSLRTLILNFQKSRTDTQGGFGSPCPQGSSQCTVAISNHVKVQLLTVQPGGGSSVQTMKSYDFDASNCAPCSDPGGGNSYTPEDTIPDGLGGILASWTEIRGPFPGSIQSLTQNVRHIDKSGAFADYSFSDLVPAAIFSGSGETLILGANNTAFGIGPRNIVAFEITTGTRNFTYQTPLLMPPGLTAATQDGGLLALQFDGFPQPQDVNSVLSFSPSGAVTASPFPTRPSSLSFFDANSLLARSGDGQGELVFASLSNPLEIDGGWGFPGSNAPGQRSSHPAHPVNFRIIEGRDAGGGATALLGETDAWESSTGNPHDLKGCTIHEVVTYPTSGVGTNGPCPVSNQTCFFPPSPPWPAKDAFANPTIPDVIDGNAMSMIPGSNPPQLGSDDIAAIGTSLSFVKPYSAVSFDAKQQHQYKCGGATEWTDLGKVYTITREIKQNAAGKFAVTVSKTDISVTSTFVLPKQ